jgi:hypothetical protein
LNLGPKVLGGKVSKQRERPDLSEKSTSAGGKNSCGHIDVSPCRISATS